jgi:hypothetical protein
MDRLGVFGSFLERMSGDCVTERVGGGMQGILVVHC